MARLGSKKSRNGCQQCKRRRVKCDEKAPCTGCVRYGFECSILHSPHSSSSTHGATQFIADSPPTSRTSSDTNNCNGPHSQSLPTSPPSNSSLTINSLLNRNSDNAAIEWMSDLELMHHYTAHAYLHIPGTTQAKQTWGYSVPQEAVQFPFLMHCILAFSAYHLAHINPSRQQKYRLLASTHQAAVLAELNQVLTNVTPRNCHAIFATSSMITLNAFADASDATIDNLLDIFRLLRGMKTVLDSTESLVHTGPFVGILRPMDNPPKPPPILSTMVSELHITSATIEDDPDGIKRARLKLKEAIQFSIDNSGHAALRAVVVWPIDLDGEFIDLLRSKENDAAKDVFEFYLRILELAATDWWFLDGWRNVSR